MFARSVGEETDIVSKEMYTWEDRGRAASDKGQSLTLRPENTAGVVRAYIEHKLWDRGLQQALLHRAAVPAGASAEGPLPAVLSDRRRDDWTGDRGKRISGPRCRTARDFWRPCSTGLASRNWTLELNSVGCVNDRAAYNEALRKALEPVKAQMCVDCQRRAVTNPLRVFDCKVPEDQPIIDKLPRISQFLDEPCRKHFEEVKQILRAVGVEFHGKRPPGARTRLLHPHRVRIHSWRSGRAECHSRRRPLRRAIGIAGRPGCSRHRLCHRRRPAGAGLAGVGRGGAAQARTCISLHSARA